MYAELNPCYKDAQARKEQSISMVEGQWQAWRARNLRCVRTLLDAGTPQRGAGTTPQVENDADATRRARARASASAIVSHGQAVAGVQGGNLLAGRKLAESIYRTTWTMRHSGPTLTVRCALCAMLCPFVSSACPRDGCLARTGACVYESLCSIRCPVSSVQCSVFPASVQCPVSAPSAAALQS